MSRNKVLYGNYSRYLNRKVHATDHCCPDSKVVCEGKRGPQGPIGITGPVGPQPTAGQTYEITFGTPTDMSYNSHLVFRPFTNANFPTNPTDSMAGYPITRASTIIEARLFLTKDLSGATTITTAIPRYYMLFKTDVSGGSPSIQFPTVAASNSSFSLPPNTISLLTTTYATINHSVTSSNNYYKSYNFVNIATNSGPTNTNILNAGDFVFAGKLKNNTNVPYISSGPMLTLVLKVN